MNITTLEHNAITIDNNAVTTGYYTAAVEKGERDGRVSNQWASRPEDQKFTSLYTLRDSVLERSLNSRSNIMNLNHVAVTADNDEVKLVTSTNELSMTNWGFNQLAAITKTPAEYVKRLPAKLAAINLQYGLASFEGNEQQVYHNEATQSLRAVTGANYGRIHDHEIIDQVIKIAGSGTGETRWKVPGAIDWNNRKEGAVFYNPFVDITKENTTLYASDRDVYLFLVDDTNPIEVGKLANGEPDLMFRGFIVWNSETGAKTFGLSTMMLRGVCQNRNLWGVENSHTLKLRHSKNAPQRFAYEAAPLLENYTNESTIGIINKVNNSKSVIVAKNKEEGFEFLTEKVKLTKNLADRVLETVLKEEGKPANSIWDMVQGITAVARTIQHQDIRLNLEQKGSALMDKIAA